VCSGIHEAHKTKIIIPQLEQQISASTHDIIFLTPEEIDNAFAQENQTADIEYSSTLVATQETILEKKQGSLLK
jgi:hypothetical protein